MERPDIGRIVVYRARGGWSAPAVISATQRTLDPIGLQRWIDTGGERGDPKWEGIPDLSSPEHVHLIVFSTGRQSAEPPLPLDANMGGTFREWDVPFWPNPHGLPVALTPRVEDNELEQHLGSWRWPVRTG